MVLTNQRNILKYAYLLLFVSDLETVSVSKRGHLHSLVTITLIVYGIVTLF